MRVGNASSTNHHRSTTADEALSFDSISNSEAQSWCEHSVCRCSLSLKWRQLWQHPFLFRVRTLAVSISVDLFSTLLLSLEPPADTQHSEHASTSHRARAARQLISGTYIDYIRTLTDCLDCLVGNQSDLRITNTSLALSCWCHVSRVGDQSVRRYHCLYSGA